MGDDAAMREDKAMRADGAVREDWARAVAARPFPRVVATDLDGTLLNAAGAISPRTAQVLESYVAAGGLYVLVTARPPRWLRGLARLRVPGGVVLACNGAFVVDLAGGVVRESHAFDPAEAAELVAALRAAFPQMRLAVETSRRMVRDTAFEADPQYDPGTPTDALESWLAAGPDEPVGKVLGRGPGIDANSLYEVAAGVVGTRAHLAYSGAVGLLELTPPHVNKAEALERWCDERAVAAQDVWAFGDMPNDLPMFSWAGTSYAVANAHPDVLAAADAVAPHHDDDGVAAVVAPAIERWRSRGEAVDG